MSQTKAQLLDSAYESGAILTGSTNNTIPTVTGANAIAGEANLTFDGSGSTSSLTINNSTSSGDAFLYVKSGEGGGACVELWGDEGDDASDIWRVQNAGADEIEFRSKTSGSYVQKFKIAGGGNVTVTDGDLVIGTSGHGIDFSATSGPGNSASDTSELLADYEEGTWTPTTHDGTISVEFAHYRKIGKQVTVWAKVSNFSDRTTNDMVRIKSLPYQPISSTDMLGGSMLGAYCNGSLIHASYVWSGGQIQFYGTGSGSYEQLRHNELNSTDSAIYFSSTYAVG